MRGEISLKLYPTPVVKWRPLKEGGTGGGRRASQLGKSKLRSSFLKKIASYSGAPSVLESENHRSLPDKITTAGEHLKLRKFCQEISGSTEVLQDETEGRGGECMSHCKKKPAANSWNATELRESTLLSPPGQWATRDALGSLAFPPNIPGIVSRSTESYQRSPILCPRSSAKEKSWSYSDTDADSPTLTSFRDLSDLLQVMRGGSEEMFNTVVEDEAYRTLIMI